MPGSPQATPEFSLRYRQFVLAMLTIVYAFNFIDRQILVILQEPIKADMGLTDAQLGLLSGFTFAVIYVSAGIPIAYLADRFNRRNIVAIALTAWSGMTALSGLAQNYTQLLLARLGVGLGEAGGSPPAHAMISDYFPPRHRGKALAVYSTGIDIGVLVGFAFGGVLAEVFGWRTAFFVVGIPGILFALLFSATVREPRRGTWDTPVAVTEKASFRETLTYLSDRPSFWWVAAGGTMVAFINWGLGNFMPSFLYRLHDMGLAEIGFTLAVVAGLAGAFGTFLGGYLADSLGARDQRWYVWIPMVGLMLTVPVATILLLIPHTPTVIALLVLFNIFSSMYLAPCIAICHGLVPAHMRAMTSAILFFILNIVGLGFGPLATGALSDLLAPRFGEASLRYAMLIAVLVGLAGVVGFFMAGRRLAADLGDDRSRVDGQTDR